MPNTKDGWTQIRHSKDEAFLRLFADIEAALKKKLRLRSEGSTAVSEMVIDADMSQFDFKVATPSIILARRVAYRMESPRVALSEVARGCPPSVSKMSLAPLSLCCVGRASGRKPSSRVPRRPCGPANVKRLEYPRPIRYSGSQKDGASHGE